MVAFTEKICERETRIHFTNGEIIGDMKSFIATEFPGLTIQGKDERGQNLHMLPGKVHHRPTVDVLSGHGGGDTGLLGNFVDAVKLGRQDVLGVTVDDILKSHLTASPLTLTYCYPYIICRFSPPKQAD